MVKMNYLRLNWFFYYIISDIDNEGVVEPDTDEPQPMGDMSAEVCFWYITCTLT